MSFSCIKKIYLPLQIPAPSFLLRQKHLLAYPVSSFFFLLTEPYFYRSEMLETTFLTLPYTRSDQYLGLVHVVVQQKPTQHCKAIILQLKLEKKVSKSHWLEFHENPLRKQTQLENLLFFLSLSSFSSCLKLGWVEVARAPADILIFRSQHGLKNEKKKKSQINSNFCKGKMFHL